MSFNSCKGFIGKWLIYETMPRYVPPRVTFRYGNEPWQVISPAEDYSVSPIYENNKRYRVVVKFHKNTGICGFSNDNNVRTFDFYGYYPPFYLAVTSYDQQINPYNGDGIYFYKKWSLNAKPTSNSSGQFYFLGWEIYSGCKINNDIYTPYSKSSPWIESITPIDGSINYEFVVYHNGQPVYQEIRDIQPEVEILPESCKYFDEDKRYVRDYYNYNKSSYMELLIQGNKAWVNAHILDINREFSYPINLYYGESDCNLPPKIDTECVPECLKCPSGTCAVPCGNVICCYNNDGVAVLSIPKERYCNE